MGKVQKANENNQVLEALADQLHTTSISNPWSEEWEVGLGHVVNLQWAIAAAEILDGEGDALGLCALKSLQLSSLQMLKQALPQWSGEWRST